MEVKQRIVGGLSTRGGCSKALQKGTMAISTSKKIKSVTAVQLQSPMHREKSIRLISWREMRLHFK
jgi:hypothetical protein